MVMVAEMVISHHKFLLWNEIRTLRLRRDLAPHSIQLNLYSEEDVICGLLQINLTCQYKCTTNVKPQIKLLRVFMSTFMV